VHTRVGLPAEELACVAPFLDRLELPDLPVANALEEPLPVDDQEDEVVDEV
jgi:hypothetical protein